MMHGQRNIKLKFSSSSKIRNYPPMPVLHKLQVF